MNHRILWLIPTVFSIIIISIPSSEAYGYEIPVYYMDLDRNVKSIQMSNSISSYLSSNDDKIDSKDKFSIHSDEEKNKENIQKYYRHVLDDTYSDTFIDEISLYGNNTAYWKHFNTDNPKPLSFSRLMSDVVLPFKKGTSDVYSISDDKTIWIDKEGIQYEKNNYDSFIRITSIDTAKKCDSPANVMTRNHCDFDKIKEYEKKKAESYLKSHYPNIFRENFAEIEDIFVYEFPKIDHRTQFLIDNEMLEFFRGVQNGKE